MKVGVRVDSSTVIGGGHAMRCLTIADELARRGASVHFFARAMIPAIAERIRAGGHELVMMSAPASEPLGAGWEKPWSIGEQKEDAREFLDRAGQCDWVVVDQYGVGDAWEKVARAGARNILVVDDLANRAHDCDMLVDQTLGRLPADYREMVPKHSIVLAGSAFAMIRPEFAALRSYSLERRRGAGPVERLLISFGLTDVGGFTLPAIKSARALDCAVIDVVVGSAAPALESIRAAAAKDSRIRLHVDSAKVAQLMAGADLVVGAAGTSSWERCCLGVPSITLCVAENQMLVASQLAREGATELADSPRTMASLLETLAADPAKRARMSAAAAAAVDGLGVPRIVDAMLGTRDAGRGQIALRRAEERDAETLWFWRNDPLMRAMAKTHEPIAWEDHERWYARLLGASNSQIFIAESRGSPAAMVRFDREGDAAVVSINVDPAQRGAGIGKAALTAAIAAYEAAGSTMELIAEVHSSNRASSRIFEAASFREDGLSPDGYLLYRRPLGSPRKERCG